MDLRNFKHSKDDIDADTWDEWLTDQAENKPKPVEVPSRTIQGGRVAGADFVSREGVPVPRSKASPKHAPKPTKKTNKTPPQPSVSIQIQVPSVNFGKLRATLRTMRPWAIGVLVLVLVVFGGKMIVDHMPKREKKQPAIPVNAQASADLGYKPLVPAPRAKGEEGPSKPVYNSNRKLYTFNDQYKGAKLTVDQQAIPDKLKGNEKEIQKIADSISADETFSTTLGNVYIFTGEKSGSQRLLLANEKMLMFIQSTKQIDTASWVSYIQSLQ